MMGAHAGATAARRIKPVVGESKSVKLILAGVAVLRRCCAAIAEGNQNKTGRRVRRIAE
jgi:hypothetical protein